MPRTETGRLIIAGDYRGNPVFQVEPRDIEAIEAEAAALERERLRAEVTALWNSDAVFATEGYLWEALWAILADPEP